MRSLIRRLRTALPQTSGEPTDEQLLDRFLARRDPDEAFGAIVRRHGPMVRGVCRRVLRNDADADDAYQAVFVVLLRKAEIVRPRNRLGNWLYGVAVNVARRGRDSVARRRTQELVTEPPEAASGVCPAEHGELKAVIDQELSGLPSAYRAAVVACDLEGQTRSEAAGRLGWSEGTVASRLARGRAILADRLTRRGVALPAAGLLVALAPTAADAVPVVSVSLLTSAPSPAAEALATEALKVMVTSKLKSVAVAALAVAGLAGAGAATVWACGGYGPRPTVPPVSEAKPYPLQSVETRDARPTDAPAAFAKPGAVEPGADKPGGDDAGGAKPARFVMRNPARDITIVSDRHETFVEFFRRQPVLVATVPDNVREKMLFDAKGATTFEFVDKASFNVTGPRVAAYGASVKLAPVSPTGPVGRLLEMTGVSEPIVFVRDAADKNLWHAVGYTTRPSAGFFADTKRAKGDDFAPSDLLQQAEKK
jgi:RNA polymerase sigma factor (sigma-70 family)